MTDFTEFTTPDLISAVENMTEWSRTSMKRGDLELAKHYMAQVDAIGVVIRRRNFEAAN